MKATNTINMLEKGILLPPHPSKCQTCAADHRPEQPHNPDSMYLKYNNTTYQGIRAVPAICPAISPTFAAPLLEVKSLIPCIVSLAEQQRALNDKIAQKNVETDKRNKEIEEANRKNRESSCKTARLNRSFAESLRTNREAAIQRYDADIAQFCN